MRENATKLAQNSILTTFMIPHRRAPDHQNHRGKRPLDRSAGPCPARIPDALAPIAYLSAGMRLSWRLQPHGLMGRDLGFIMRLPSRSRIKHLPFELDADALGPYVYGRFDGQTNQLENAIIAEGRREQLRVTSVDAL